MYGAGRDHRAACGYDSRSINPDGWVSLSTLSHPLSRSIRPRLWVGYPIVGDLVRTIRVIGGIHAVCRWGHVRPVESRVGIASRFGRSGLQTVCIAIQSRKPRTGKWNSDVPQTTRTANRNGCGLYLWVGVCIYYKSCSGKDGRQEGIPDGAVKSAARFRCPKRIHDAGRHRDHRGLLKKLTSARPLSIGLNSCSH